MATIAKLVAELSLDNNAFLRGIDGARAKLDALGESARSTGRALTTRVTAPLVGLGAYALSTSATVENAIGKTESVFGDSADSVVDWSNSTSSALGIWRGEALQSASSYGALFNVMDIADDKSAQYSMSLVGLTADMAAFNDVSTQRASDAIMSGLSGEYMSLRSLGVFINEASVSQEALNIATADGRTEVTEADKVLARYNLIMEQTAQQQGQAAREADSFSGRLTATKAKLRDVAAAFGEHLLKPAGQFLEFIKSLLDKLAALSPRMQMIIIIIAAVAAAMGPLLIAIGFMLPGLSALLGLFALLASPITLVVLAIIALAAVAVVLYKKWEPFHNLVNKLASALKRLTKTKILPFLENIGDIIGKLSKAFEFYSGRTNVVSAALMALAAVFPGLRSHLQPIIDLTKRLADAFSALRAAGLNPVQAALGALAAVFPAFANTINAVRDAVAHFTDMFRHLGEAFGEFFGGNWQDGFRALGAALLDFFQGIGQMATVGMRALYDAFRAINWGALLDGAQNILGQLAGKLGDLAAWIVQWIADAVPTAEEWRALVSKAGDIITGLSGKLGDLVAWVARWIADAIPGLDTWRSLVSKAGDIITGLSGKLGNLIAWVAQWIADAVPGLDTWRSLVSKAGDIITGLSGKLGDLVSWVVRWITDAVPGLDTWKLLTSKAGDIITGLSGKLGNLIKWVAKWITDAVPSLDTWRSLTSKAGDIITGLSSKLGNLIKWVGKWIADAIPNAESWKSLANNVVDITGTIIGKLGDIATTMGGWAQSGVDAAQAVWDAITFDIPFIDIGGGGKKGDNDAVAMSAIAVALEDARTRIDAAIAGINATLAAFDGASVGVTLNTALVSGIGALSGESLGAAIQGWIQRGFTVATNRVATGPARGVAVALNTALTAGLGALSGESLGIAIFRWMTAGLLSAIDRINGGVAKGVAVALNAALVDAIGSMSGASLGTAVAGWITRALNKASADVTSSLNQINKSFTDFCNNVLLIVSTTFSALPVIITAHLSTAKTSVVTAFSQASLTVATECSRMVTSVRTGASNMAAAMSDGMSRLRAAVSSVMGQIPGVVASVGGSAASAAYSVGANISQAFASGMRSRLGEIVAAGNAMVDSARRAVVAEAMIHSPSRLFWRLGEEVPAGFAGGIDSGSDRVAAAAAAMVSIPGSDQGSIANGGGAAPIIQIITLEPGRWREFLADAEAGGKFARQFGGELALRSGRV